jgi:predicted RNase H-like HicB family nuclease
MTAVVRVPEVQFKIRLAKNRNGVITVECVSLPGCVSQGRTREEALRNIREAIVAWLEAEEEARRKGWKRVWERGSR